MEARSSSWLHTDFVGLQRKGKNLSAPQEGESTVGVLRYCTSGQAGKFGLSFGASFHLKKKCRDWLSCHQMILMNNIVTTL